MLYNIFYIKENMISRLQLYNRLEILYKDNSILYNIFYIKKKHI